MIPCCIGTMAAAERLMKIEALPLEKAGTTENTEKFTRPDIEFKDVTFGYKENTTIIRLLLSLINPQQGSAALRGENLYEECTRDKRHLISYVPQGSTLFYGTIRDNLKYGNPNATYEIIKESLKKACALDFVEDLDEDLNTQ